MKFFSSCAFPATVSLLVLLQYEGSHAGQLRRGRAQPRTRRGENAHAPAANLCMWGHLVPELFLLGAPHGGSDLFFEDFARSRALVHYQLRSGEHPWRVNQSWQFASESASRTRLRRSDWLSHFPKCTQHDRKVAFDGTLEYFGDRHAAGKIYNLYTTGQTTSLVSKLTFMVFLREPLSRAHSHYYQYIRSGVREGVYDSCPPEVFPETFSAAVHQVLTTGAMCRKCECNRIFEDSMYVDAFRRYFDLFNPAQFHVVPFKAAMQPALVNHAWDVLRMPHGRGHVKERVLRVQDHPDLERDLDDQEISNFTVYLQARAGPQAVATQLVNTSANLYGFAERSNSTDKIAHWLSLWWGM